MSNNAAAGPSNHLSPVHNVHSHVSPVHNVNSAVQATSESRSTTPQPKRPSPTAPFHPPADTSTYRDLLLFEERLKLNAEMLRRRKRRYSVFLYSFMAGLSGMGYHLVVMPPDNIVLLRGLQAVVAVVFITLALFFASGMYDEKIRYSHSYINHSNRALRPLNMYLNVRRAPASFLNFLPLPAAFRPSPGPMKAQPAARRPSQGNLGLGPSPAGSAPVARRVSHSSSLVMAQIPPSQNPRGELIFSSRVDHHFEEGYKRYRAAFERRREERSREEARAQGKWWHPSYWQRLPPVVSKGIPGQGGSTPPQSLRGTPPPGLRQSSPPASPRRRVRSDPKPADKEDADEVARRDRAESYSFVFTPPAPSEAVGAKAARG